MQRSDATAVATAPATTATLAPGTDPVAAANSAAGSTNSAAQSAASAANSAQAAATTTTTTTAPVTVPNVMGMTETQASATLKAAGLVVNSWPACPGASVDLITIETPGAGTVFAPGSGVSLDGTVDPSTPGANGVCLSY
jgi:predicted deacylase